MIQLSEQLRNALDTNSRVGIQHIIEVYSPTDYQAAFNFEIAELNSSSPDYDPSRFDSAGNTVALTLKLLDSGYKYHDFHSWEKDTYNTLAPKKLYRTMALGEDDHEYYNEYASGVISASSNISAGNPFVFNYRATDLGASYETNGFTIEFGNDETIYPTDFEIVITNNNGNVKKTITVKDNKKLLYTEIFNIPDFYNAEIKINKMNRDNVKCRISKIILGFSMFFDNDIISVSVKRSSHPISSEAPDISLNFTIWDSEDLFDPQNANGVYDLIQGNELVLDYLYYNGSKELIGTYNLDGKPSVTGKQATFNGKSGFWGLLNSHNYEFTGNNSISPQDFTNLAISNATGFHDYFNTQYTDTRDLSYFKGTATEIVQKFSNLIFGILIEDKYSNVVISQIGGNGNGLPTTYNSASAIPLLQNLICGEITLDTSSQYADDCNVNYYGNSGIAGYYDKNGNHAGKQGGETSNFVIDNNIVSIYTHAQIINTLYNHWYKKSKIYIIPYMADPSIELGDFVSFDDKYGYKHYGIILENNYSSPLSTSDTLKVITVDDITV